MQFRALAAAAVAFVAFGTVSADTGPLGVVSYPRVCGNVCGPVVTVSQEKCLKDDLSCICYQNNMKQLVPICEGCAYNQRGSKNGKEFYPAIKSALQKCGFKSTSVTLGAAAPTAMPLVGAGAAAIIAGLVAL